MVLFLLTFFLIYGSVHAYAFLKARAALAFGVWTGIFVAAFMALMIAAPFIVRFSEKAGLEPVARFTAYVGYTWLGFLFLFFSYSITIDIYKALAYSAGYIFHKDPSAITLSQRHAFLLPLFLALITSVYGYFEAKNIRVENVTIKTSKIPANVGRLRIAQISDVHLGLIIREERLKNILDKVQAANPDILISTGDLVDGQVCKLNGLTDLMKEINPRYGKFAITGNHEFYAGIENSLCFSENAGFRILRGEALTVGNIINIAGADDPAAIQYKEFRHVPEKDLLSGLPKEKFTLFLKHRPELDKAAVGLFDLQLSGHIHKGQLFPFTIVTWLYYPAISGLAKVSDNSYFYVNRGAGTWGPPIRFLAPPEVTVIDLVHDKQ